jgi:hypothetical protein
MSCGTKSNDAALKHIGLIEGHSYSIVYPHKWKEKNIYLVKLRNPWGKNEWRGNWSDYSPLWTPEFVKYFNYQKTRDGTLWLDINDIKKYFDNTFICHILYGALVKYFFFEYSKYFKKPTIFNFSQTQRAQTSISVLFRSKRFNREINNVIHPFSLILCKYDKYRRIEKVWNRWDCEDELNIVDTLDPGYYCIWMYCPINFIKGDPNFKYILQVSSLSQYEIEFLGLDHDFSLIQYILTNNYKTNNPNLLNCNKNYSIVNLQEAFDNGLFNTLIYNLTSNEMEVNVTDNGVVNCQLLPPYEGMSHFRIAIPPYESGAIIGIRISNNSGKFSFKFATKTQGNPSPQFGGSNQDSIVSNRFSNFLKFDISSNSPNNNALRTEEYKYIKKDLAKKIPNFNTNEISAKENLRQTTMIQHEITPQMLTKQIPNEFNILFKKYPQDIEPHVQKKWTKLKIADGVYIGQINSMSGELEGRGVFYWKNGTKYIGYFRKNSLHGYGLLLDKNNQIIYDGLFYYNKRNGYGKLYYGQGEYYEGQFANNELEGSGCHYYNNGDKWEGEYRNRMKNGVGLMIRKNGEMFLAEYENDNFMGQIELTNEEKKYFENLRARDRKEFYERIKNFQNQGNNFGFKNNISIAAFDLFKKKRDLTKSIRVFN